MTTDEWDEFYAGGHRSTPVNELWLDMLLKAMGPQTPRTAIDLGCGTGELVLALSKRGLAATGIDFSKRAISIARRQDPKGSYIIGNAITFTSESRYDVVILRSLITQPLDHAHLLRTAQELLATAGCCILTACVYWPSRFHPLSYTTSSIPHDELIVLISRQFKSVRLLHTNYIGQTGAELTYLLKK